MTRSQSYSGYRLQRRNAAEGSTATPDVTNVAAYQWMMLAAQNGNAQCSQGITALIPQMTPEQVAEAKRRIQSWSPKPHPQFNY